MSSSSLTDNALLIAIVVMSIYSLAIEIVFFSYLLAFWKNKKIQHKYIDKPRVIVIGLTNIPALSFIIAASVLFANNPYSHSHWTAIIVLVVLGFLIPLALTIYLFMGLQYIAVGISDNAFHMLGEKVLIKNIVNLKFDSLSSKYFLNHKDIKRRQPKKITLKKDCKSTMFILERGKLLDVTEIEQIPVYEKKQNKANN